MPWLGALEWQGGGGSLSLVPGWTSRLGLSCPGAPPATQPRPSVSGFPETFCFESSTSQGRRFSQRTREKGMDVRCAEELYS